MECKHGFEIGRLCDSVEGLALLRESFDVLQGWSGDPCLPAPYSWDWINCSSDSTPRVTALYVKPFFLVIIISHYYEIK